MIGKLTFGLLSLVLLLSLVTGCGESDIKQVTSDSKNTEEPQGQSKVQTYKIGDTVDVDGLQITVNGVRTSKGGQLLKPQSAKFIYIDATIENKTDKPAPISSIINLKLADKEGVQYTVALVDDQKGQLDGEIGPGRKIKGEATFDVSESEYYEFIFENPLKSGQAIWKIENVK